MLARMQAVTWQRALLAITVVGTAALVAAGRSIAPVFVILVTVVPFTAYAALVLSLSKARLVSTRALIIAFAALMIFAVALPPRSSRDLWAYLMYGRIVAQHHASPYTHAPAEYPHDPIYPRVYQVFKNTKSVYGPAFTAVSAAGAAVCGSSQVCGRLFFQLLEALAVLGAVLIVFRSTQSWAAAAFVGLNPMVIASIVNSAHNEGLIALLVLGAGVIARARPGAAGLLVGLAMAIKINAGIALIALCIWLLIARGWRPAVTAAATAVAVLVPTYLAAGGRRVLGPLRTASMSISHHSFWHALLQGHSRSSIAHVGIAGTIALAIVLALGRARTGGPIPVFVAAFAAYIVTTPYILPWYTATLIPLLALRLRSKTTWALFAYSALLFLVYPTHASTHPGLAGHILSTMAVDVLPIVEIIIIVALIVTAWRPRRQARAALR